MKKSILLILFFISGYFANSQCRLPVKVFSKHIEGRKYFGKSIRDYIVTLNSDSTIEVINYDLINSFDLPFSHFIRNIYFGKYELRNDSIFISNLLVSQIIKNNDQKKYYTINKSLQKPSLIHSVFLQ